MSAFQVVTMSRTHMDVIAESPVFEELGEAKLWQSYAGRGEGYFTVMCIIYENGDRMFGYVDEKEVW